MKNKKEKIKQKLEDLFGIDIRSLALMRVGFAVLIIIDLINRSKYLYAHYTDNGVLPRSVLLDIEKYDFIFSLHALGGGLAFQSVLFVIAGVFAILMLIGYKTRFVTIMSWLLLVSLHNRNFLIIQGGDELLRIALFWAMFLPLGDKFSIDSLRNKIYTKKIVTNFASSAYLMQIVIVYIFVLIERSWKIWVIDARAVEIALKHDGFVTSFGKLLLFFPEITAFLSRAVMAIELIGPILLFLPFLTQRARIFGLVLLFLLHFCILFFYYLIYIYIFYLQ